VFREWRNRLAIKSKRQADYAWAVLARILAVGLDYGWLDANPCERGGRLYRGSRRDKIWTLDDELAFVEKAPRHLHLPLTLALWTGQRQGDLLRLAWSAYDGTNIALRQSLRDVRSILDSHYLHRDPALAEAAIQKLEARTNSPKRAPN
jgi:integrase